jgi:hypothetical protein
MRGLLDHAASLNARPSQSPLLSWLFTLFVDQHVDSVAHSLGGHERSHRVVAEVSSEPDAPIMQRARTSEDEPIYLASLCLFQKLP